MTLLCPKCTNPMKQYERNDVLIDQCVECGGLFLDRGELERLAQAEANYYNPQNAAPLPERTRDDRYRREDRRDDRDRYDDRDRRYDRDRYDDRDRREDRYDDRDRRYRDDDRRYDDRRYRDDDRNYRKRKKKDSFFGEVFDLLG